MKLMSILLAVFLTFFTGARLTFANSRQSQSESRAEKVRASVRKLGVGESARVEIRLQDGTKLKGYITEAGEDSFVVMEGKPAASRTIAYEQVDRIKGKGLSTGTKVAIGFGIAAAVLGTLVIIGLTHLD